MTTALSHAPLSYESLDRFNCTSETLKITDDYQQQKNNIINTMNQIALSETIIASDLEQHISIKQQPNKSYKLMNSSDNYMSSSLRKNNKNSDYDSIMNVDDNEAALNKQKQLSDWYYIKTSPKAKPTSPYERRRIKNLANSQAAKIPSPLQPLVISKDLLEYQTSCDKLSSLPDLPSFSPIQKYRSNDYIEHQQFLEEKSPLQSYKCFSMKYSRDPSGKSGTMTKFGEMTSSSFEHVNVTGLYENRLSGGDIKTDDDYVQRLRMAAAKMRPLPQAPAGNEYGFQVSSL